MREQAPQETADYLQLHPNAVVDPAKAMVMAHASHGQEEAFVVARGLALQAASNIGNREFRGSGNRDATNAARHHSHQAEKAREVADNQARLAGNIYDQVAKSSDSA